MRERKFEAMLKRLGKYLEIENYMIVTLKISLNFSKFIGSCHVLQQVDDFHRIGLDTLSVRILGFYLFIFIASTKNLEYVQSIRTPIKNKMTYLNNKTHS